MPVRPRVVLLDAFREGEPALGPLKEHADIVAAPTPEAALRLLQEGAADGILCLPSGERGLNPQSILMQLEAGLAIIDAGLRLVWFNPAFARTCEGQPIIGGDAAAALGAADPVRPGRQAFLDCLNGTMNAALLVPLRSGRYLELHLQRLPPSDVGGPVHLLALVSDVTASVREHEKLIAIHRAGLELSHLTPEELARMTTTERIALLKANILQYSQNILNFRNLEIRLLEPRSGRLTVLLSEGMTEFDSRRELFAQTNENGVTGFVAATGQSVICDDVRRDPRYLPGAHAARSSLTVPIIYRDRVIGTFNVESEEAQHFTDKDREFLEVFAREIAVALHTLELLQAEKNFAGSASCDAMLAEVSLPSDDIISDAIRILDHLREAEVHREPLREAAQRLLAAGRTIKSAIQKVGQTYASDWRELPRSETATTLAGRRILVVDADPAIRRAAHTMLARIGSEVDAAKDGREALGHVHTIQYDAILADIRLPDMNGYDFFSLMRKEAPATPLILMTGFGYDTHHSLVRARQEGQRAVLYKPFRLDRLREAIEDALNPKAAARPAGGLGFGGKESIL